MLARAATMDAVSPSRPEAVRHGWHRLAVLADGVGDCRYGAGQCPQ
jgi:hypothetical protein